jgi:hypothetical protein
MSNLSENTKTLSELVEYSQSLSTTDRRMPEIRFASMSSSAQQTGNGLNPNEGTVAFTFEIIGGGYLRNGDQLCLYKRHSSSRINPDTGERTKKYRLHCKFAHTLSENEIGQNHIVINTNQIQNALSSTVRYDQLFYHNNRQTVRSRGLPSMIYARIRRTLASGQIILSNTVVIPVYYGLANGELTL